MELGFTTAVYVVAAVLFILSLGGLSGQESAKRAVWYGIVGMARDSCHIDWSRWRALVPLCNLDRSGGAYRLPIGLKG